MSSDEKPDLKAVFKRVANAVLAIELLKSGVRKKKLVSAEPEDAAEAEEAAKAEADLAEQPDAPTDSKSTPPNEKPGQEDTPAAAAPEEAAGKTAQDTPAAAAPEKSAGKTAQDTPAAEATEKSTGKAAQDTLVAAAAEETAGKTAQDTPAAAAPEKSAGKTAQDTTAAAATEKSSGKAAQDTLVAAAAEKPAGKTTPASPRRKPRSDQEEAKVRARLDRLKELEKGSPEELQAACLYFQTRFRGFYAQTAFQQMKWRAHKQKKEFEMSEGAMEEEELRERYGTLKVNVRGVHGLGPSRKPRFGSLSVRLVKSTPVRRKQSAGIVQLFLSCEVVGKPETRCFTKAVKADHQTAPVWDETHECMNWNTGDGLQIQVWSRREIKGEHEDEVLGAAILNADAFSGLEGANGFDGDLPLAPTQTEKSAAPAAFAQANKVATVCSVRVRVEMVVAKIVIESAEGLQNAVGWTKPDAYVLCEVSNRPHKNFQTHCHEPSRHPNWNFTHVLTQVTPEDSLAFSVYHAGEKEDELLGTATMPCKEALVAGCQVDLRLDQTPNNCFAFLKIRTMTSMTALSCMFELKDKEWSRKQTSWIPYTLNPVWDEAIVIPCYEAGDRLMLTLYEQCGLDCTREALGHTELFTSQFTWPKAPRGFRGEMNIEPELPSKGQNDHEGNLARVMAAKKQAPLLKLRVEAVLDDGHDYNSSDDDIFYNQKPVKSGKKSKRQSLAAEESGDAAGSAEQGDASMSESSGEDSEIERLRIQTAHGQGGGSVNIAHRSCRDHFAVLNRKEFEKVILALESGSLSSYAAAAHLRAADRRSGAVPADEVKHVDSSLDLGGGLVVSELKEVFDCLKGLLAFTYGTIDKRMQVADTEARRAAELRRSLQFSAKKIQSFWKMKQAAKRTKSLLADRDQSALFDCFHLRCNAPPSIGAYFDVMIYLFYKVGSAHVKVSIIDHDGMETVEEVGCQTKELPDGVLLFTPAADREEEPRPPFQVFVRGPIGGREIRIGPRFPVLDQLWDEVPPLLESHCQADRYRVVNLAHMSPETRARQGRASAVDELEDDEVAEEEVEDLSTAEKTTQDRRRESPSTKQTEIMHEGWLQAWLLTMKWKWLYAVLQPTRLVLYSAKDQTTKMDELHFTQAFRFLAFKDRNAPPLVAKFKAHRFGFLIQPDGKVGKTHLFDADDAVSYKEWHNAIMMAATSSCGAVAGASTGFRKQLGCPRHGSSKKDISDDVARRIHAVLCPAFKKAQVAKAGSAPRLLLAELGDAATGLIDVEVFKSILRMELRIPQGAYSEEDMEKFMAALEPNSTGALLIDPLCRFLESGNADILRAAKEEHAAELAAMQERRKQDARGRNSADSQGLQRRMAFAKDKTDSMKPVFKRPTAAANWCIAWYVDDHAEGELFPSRDAAVASFLRRTPEYQGAGGVIGVCLFGRNGEELRYYGSRCVKDDLLMWRELNSTQKPFQGLQSRGNSPARRRVQPRQGAGR
eukprot:TRINITY_DN7891_c0_g1_i2.p1 TRINITY_DN7891_c0_g1~~TRINITY_DN7891_c0_g1_i2.p1  ORF type:complete len:1485 (+),score=381.06 TRINITY_DN7891_c0_g1_i2:157-4611(+)